MYTGDTTDGSGLHNMVYELVNNAIGEVLAKHCNRIEVSLNPDGSVTVCDNGRGIPVDIHPKVGKPAAEFIMTELHAVGIFVNDNQKMRNGLPGIGPCVVNALSEYFDVRIWRQGHEWFMRFRRGEFEMPLKSIGRSSRTGTEITFLPDPVIFKNIEFDLSAIEQRLRSLPSLNSGAFIVLTDKRNAEKKEIVLQI